MAEKPKRIVYAQSDGCTSPDNKHSLEGQEPPFYQRCVHCGQNFYLVSESAMNRAGISVTERPITEN